MQIRRRRILTLLTAVLPVAACLVLGRPARADDLSAARNLIQTAATQLLAVVNSSQSDAQKETAMHDLVAQAVDVDGVARFVIGRFWRQATPAQQQDYMQTFRQLLVYAVTGQASSFQGASFSIVGVARRDVGIVVDTNVTVPGKPQALVQWVVATVGGQPKIIDILAEGTSLRLTERNDYAGVISQHGGQIQPLLDAMHHQLARFQSNAAG